MSTEPSSSAESHLSRPCLRLVHYGRKNLVLYGLFGAGEPYLATVLGVTACERSIRAHFFTVTKIFVHLSASSTRRFIESTYAMILKAWRLMLEGRGYESIDIAGVLRPFRIISENHENRSLIIKDNTGYSKMGFYHYR